MLPRRRDIMDVIKELDRAETCTLCFRVSEWALTFESYEANKRDYTMLLQRYGRRRRIADCERVYRQMQEASFEPDMVSCTIMIEAYGRAKEVDKAAAMLAEISRLGMAPDHKAYCALIIAFGSAARPTDAEGVLLDMEDAGCLPNQHIYSALMTAYGRQGLADDAQRIFDRMQFRTKLLPDAKCYTSLLDAYGRAGEPEKARTVFQNMRKVGYVPDDLALSLMVEAYTHKGMCREAVAAVLEVEQLGQRPGVETMTALIGLFGKQKLLAEAEEVFHEMKQASPVARTRAEITGLDPTRRTYTQLYAAYAAAGQASKAQVVLEEMRLTGWTPDEYSYSKMLEALLYGGCNSEALTLHQRVVELGLQLQEDLEQRITSIRELQASRQSSSGQGLVMSSVNAEG
eukprot:SM000044S15989  [mRNA]  locus=s44:435109:437018:+ [translate_table: standard]